MTAYGSPLSHAIPLAVFILLFIGTAIMVLLDSEFSFSDNPVPARVRNCTSCRNGMDSTNQACLSCRSGSGYRPRV